MRWTPERRADPGTQPMKTTTRAGLVLALLLPLPTIGAWVGLVGMPGPVGSTVYAASRILILVIPLAWLWFVEDGRWSLSPLRDVRGLGAGLATGGAMAALLAVGFLAFGGDWVDAGRVRDVAEAAGFGTPATFVLLAGYLTLVNALLEEYVWRWFVYARFRDVVDARLAVVGCAAGFTLHHVLVLWVHFGWGVAAYGSVAVFGAGLVWSWLYHRYGSVWPGYVSHVVVDAAIVAIGWRILFG
jgi:membrane protease YdiL (CAAX protease family)